MEEQQLSFPDGPRLDLDEAIASLLAHAERVRTTQERLRALLSATQAVVEESELSVVLRRIVDAAVALVDAEYGALGVISPEGDSLDEFIYVGLDESAAAAIGNLPTGHGLLGALIVEPHPIRLSHMRSDRRASGFPAHHPPMDSFLGVPVRVRGEVFGNLYLTNRREGQFTSEDEQLIEALATTAGFAIENARLLDQARTRERWMKTAAELSSSVLSSPTETSLDLISGRIFDLPDIDQVTIVLTDDEGKNVRVAAARGPGEATLRGSVLETDAVCAGSVLSDGKPRSLPRGEPTDDPLRLTRDGAEGPVLVAPLRTRARLWGAVCIARSPSGRRFTATETESAADLASRASIALELAHAREEGQRSMLADDRRRIARDLHDHVIQQLFGTGLTLQAVASGLPSGPATERLNESVAQLDDAITQIRNVIFALSHSDSSSIRHHIIDAVAELTGSLTRPPVFRFIGPVDHAITGPLAADVLGAARELLSNAVRHSQADRISVEVGVVDGLAVVSVEDNGVGIPATGRRSGLDNVAHRANARGGEFSLDTSETGTVAKWSVPLADE
ncbi:GAF domain-containing protein [Microbacterium sp. SD291]|uniref:sensor histidine kinase n=1 Tax=Microbacterium sp. SD291 TaxID=2782007 RepID=UPI001A97B282|nr:GAF domain-containing protein [Microbacterium sp. SD291]MBO0980630.1 GAF domain-containing protein [Microbacterium sp. SD291]